MQLAVASVASGVLCGLHESCHANTFVPANVSINRCKTACMASWILPALQRALCRASSSSLMRCAAASVTSTACFFNRGCFRASAARDMKLVRMAAHEEELELHGARSWGSQCWVWQYGAGERARASTIGTLRLFKVYQSCRCSIATQHWPVDASQERGGFMGHIERIAALTAAFTVAHKLSFLPYLQPCAPIRRPCHGVCGYLGGL